MSDKTLKDLLLEAEDHMEDERILRMDNPPTKSRANAKQYGGQHYKDMGIEPWDVIDTWPIEQRIGAYRAGVLKYVMRLGTKDERLKEASKCMHYAEKLVEVLESKDERGI